MLHDCRGLSVTSDSDVAVAAYDEAVHAFLTQSAAAEAALARSLAADSGFLLPHALRGFLGRLSARRVYDPVVESSRKAVAASLAQRGGTIRERRMAAALEHLAEDRASDALALIDRSLEGDPLDAMAVKLEHTVRFQLGLPAAMRRSIEAVLPAWDEAVPGYGYILGCRAFASGETGDLAGAERHGRAALRLRPDDRWGAHAVAHVFEMRGEGARGVEWLDAVLAADPSADGFNRHIGWHRALALIGLGQLDRALDAFDNHVWAQPCFEYRDVANAVSLLRRVEMAGGSVGDRWERVCDASAALLDDRRLAFSDAHAVLGLMRAGRASVAKRALARLEEAAATGELARSHYPDCALPLMRALVTRQAETFEAAMLRFDRLGGSAVQRDLFVRSAVEAMIAADRPLRAAGVLTQRAERFAACRWSMAVERLAPAVGVTLINRPVAA